MGGKMDTSFVEELKKCKARDQIYRLLKLSLRSHKFFANKDDPSFYKGVADAAHFIEVHCMGQGTGEQNNLREFGVLEILMDTLLAFFNRHLKLPSTMSEEIQENVRKVLNSAHAIKCWTHLCMALLRCVDSPMNGTNQEALMKKLVSSQGLKQILRFISSWTEEYLEIYVVPIVQLLKGLVAENMKVQFIVSSHPELLNLILQSFEVRIQIGRISFRFTWKSIDMLSCVLNWTLKYKNQEEGANGKGNPDEKLELEKRLCDIVHPCVRFMAWCEESDSGQSVGNILLVTSIFARSLESVRRFRDFNGNEILSNISGSHQPEPVKEAIQLLLSMLKCRTHALHPIQKKRTEVKEETTICCTKNERNTDSFSKDLEAFFKDFKIDAAQMTPVPPSLLPSVKGFDCFAVVVTNGDFRRNGRHRRALDPPRHQSNMQLVPVIPRVKGGGIKKRKEALGILQRFVNWMLA